MSNDWKQPPAFDASAVVRVNMFGSDTMTLDYDPEKRVVDYLDAAEIKVMPGQGVSLNGKETALNARVEPNSVIVVANQVTNG